MLFLLGSVCSSSCPHLAPYQRDMNDTRFHHLLCSTYQAARCTNHTDRCLLTAAFLTGKQHRQAGLLCAPFRRGKHHILSRWRLAVFQLHRVCRKGARPQSSHWGKAGSLPCCRFESSLRDTCCSQCGHLLKSFQPDIPCTHRCSSTTQRDTDRSRFGLSSALCLAGRADSLCHLLSR